MDVKQFVFKFILPSLCLIGVLTNTINVIVFSRRTHLKNVIYRYLFCHSLVDLLYLFFCLVRFIVKLDCFSDIYLSFWVQVYEAYIYRYFTACLAAFMMLMELIIAFKRLLIIMNIRFSLPLRKTIFTCAVFSILLFLPYALSLRVIDQRKCQKTVNNIQCLNQSSPILYAITQDNVPCLAILRRLYIIGSVFRAVLAPAALLVINAVIIVKFRKFFARKCMMFPSRQPEFNGKLICVVLINS